MYKKIISIVILTLIGLPAVISIEIQPEYIEDMSKNTELIEKNIVPFIEILDQKQNSDCGWWRLFYGSNQLAQNFTPTLTTLTKAQLKFGYKGSISDDTEIILSIREGLWEEDLAVSAVTFSELSNSGWGTFYFTNLTTIPGKNYFMVVQSSYDADANNRLGWLFQTYNPYPYGNAWVTEDSGRSWQILESTSRPERDFRFLTYGDNFAPNNPTITGPSSGKAGDIYNYTIMTTDPESDEISYYVDWGDGNTGGWTGLLPSGEAYGVSHIWEEEGNYIIKVKAKDSYETESEWATLEVTMPKAKTFDLQMLFYQFLQNHPHLFPLLRQLLDL